MSLDFNNALNKVVAGMVKEPVKFPAPDREKLAMCLESWGFSSVIAGEHDFNKALDAITLARVEGRGLLISGDNGVGKTVLLRAIYDTYYRRQHRLAYPGERPSYYHDADWIDCNEPNHLQWLTEDDLLRSNIFLDDFGSERMLYGDVDAVGAFICRWYSRRADGCRFYVTTNLSSEQVNERSGGRVFDRLCEMCVAVHLDGKSKRKVMAAK